MDEPGVFHILSIGQDHLGAFMKARVVLNASDKLIRWGLDRYTFAELQSALTDVRWDGRPNIVLAVETKYDRRAGHVAYLYLGNDSSKVTRMFFCSDLFASNVAWLRGIRHSTELEPLIWRNVVSWGNGPSSGPSNVDDAQRNRRRRYSKRTFLSAAICIAVIPFLFGVRHWQGIGVQTHPTVSTVVKSKQDRNPSIGDVPHATAHGSSVASALKTTAISSIEPPNAPQTNDNVKVQTTRADADADEKFTLTKSAHVPEIYGVDDGEVALTFDDGPSKYTNRILSILNQYRVNATFFFIGNRIELWPSAVKNAVESGDIVGDHSESHPILTNLSSEDQAEQIVAGANEIETHGSGNVTLFRPPYEAFDDATEAELKNEHMTLALWNRDPRDWSATTPQEVIMRVLGNHPSGGVFDLHENEYTVAALPTIIESLQRQGLKLVVLHPPTS